MGWSVLLGDIVLMVKHIAHNDGDVGSNPTVATAGVVKWYHDRLITYSCGSNPTLRSHLTKNLAVWHEWI